MKKTVIIVLLVTTSLILFSSHLIENLRFSAPSPYDGVITRGELGFFMMFHFIH